jgi:hypothetical protein
MQRLRHPGFSLLQVRFLLLKRYDLPNNSKVPSAWWAKLHSRHQHFSVEQNVRPQEKALLRMITPGRVVTPDA